MVYGSQQKVKRAKDVEIKVKYRKLQIVPSLKYLGMSLDSTLNYNHHIASVIHRLTLLGKMKRYLRDDTAIEIDKCGCDLQ